MQHRQVMSRRKRGINCASLVVAMFAVPVGLAMLQQPVQAQTASPAPDAFKCDKTKYYQSRYGGMAGEATRIYEIDLNPYVAREVTSGSGLNGKALYNGLAYSSTTNYLYLWQVNLAHRGTLTVVNNQGKILPMSHQFSKTIANKVGSMTGATMDKNDIYYGMSDQNGTALLRDSPPLVFKVDTNVLTNTDQDRGFSEIALSPAAPVDPAIRRGVVGDMAIDPLPDESRFGDKTVVYAGSSGGGGSPYLMRIVIEDGTYEIIGNTAISFGSLFFHQDGTLYGYENARPSEDSGTLYKISKTDGTLTKVMDVPRAAGSDGASCAFTPVTPPVDPAEPIVPKVQFWGADVRSGGKTVTKHDVMPDKKVYGSWTEYAIVSGEAVSSSSGAGLSSSKDGLDLPLDADARDYNKLTFSNTNSSALGHYGTILQTTLPTQLTHAVGTEVAGSGMSMAGIASGSGVKVYTKNGNLTLDGGTIPAGTTVVIRATGRVTIAGDISYAPGPYSSSSDMPQLVIIAHDIVIDGAVERVDAWLVAKDGYVSTCGAVASPSQWLDGITGSACDKKLTINGPVVANKLYLRRTHGAVSGDRHAPAETLNLRPDTYLWARGQADSNASIRTTHVKELPPRW